MTEDYVSFETAKLLKEKGFDGKCYKVWAHYTSSTPKLWAAPTFVEGETIVDRESVESAERVWNMIYADSENKYHGYLAPTLQMAMKWLREKNIFIDIYHYNFRKAPFVWLIFAYNKLTPRAEQTYEQAAESAIKYILENWDDINEVLEKYYKNDEILQKI